MLPQYLDMIFEEERVDKEHLYIFLLGSCSEYRGGEDKSTSKDNTLPKKLVRPVINLGPTLEDRLMAIGYSGPEERTGDLNIGRDVQNMIESFGGQARYWDHTKEFKKDKEKAMKEIRAFFANGGERAVYLLTYSGHGTFPTFANQGGNWMFQDGVITLEEVLDVWSSSSTFQKCQHTYLVIVIDACYSGCWVERLRNPEYVALRVIIQASTAPDQTSLDTQFGGAFLCFWLKHQLNHKAKGQLPHTPTFGSTLGNENLIGISVSPQLWFVRHDSEKFINPDYPPYQLY